MSTQSLPHSIALHGHWAARLVNAANTHGRSLLNRWQARSAAHAEWRSLLQAERDLARLSPRTLQDIGAPHGLVGQRRWQEEQEATQVSRILDRQGW